LLFLVTYRQYTKLRKSAHLIGEMTGRFLWADGQLHLLPGLSKTTHKQMVARLSFQPANFASGDFNLTANKLRVLLARGSTPTDAELNFMIHSELSSYGREQRIKDRIAVNTEDTEPSGGEGYLKDPHDNLYPYLFPTGGTKMPEKVRHLLKSHVLNQLEEAFEDPDNFIYFTCYGSGISYNWDEGGDLDIQMWVDIEKFQALNEEKATWTMDDLLAEVRRNVQLVNFPTVKEIGLSPGKDDDESTGEMLIQYYPKPGKGTKEENLAQQPYACLDLETGEWLVPPKPFDPEFYGLHFLEVMPKATDMAIQAEALLDEFERNVLNWQFWFSLYSRYRNPAYQEQYQEAQKNAIMEKSGIENMFHGIFGGRQEAYSPGGKGIEDERDMTQKLLEVWGIFQRLKHYSRAPLPWDEQELPTSPEEVGEDSAESDTEQQNRDSRNKADDFIVSHGWTVAQKMADHNGWTNYETWWVETWIDNEQHTNEIANDLVTRGDIKAFEQWAIETFIAPNNAEAIKGAQEWNDIPEPERIDHNLEDLKNKYEDNPDALNAFDGLFGQGDVGDITPNIIDPNVVNWHELFTHRQQDMENEYRFEHGMPLTWEEETDQDAPGDSTFPSEWTSKWRFAGQYDSPEHRDPGGWQGIMEKAQRLRSNGQVQVQRNGVQNIVGTVQGDHGTYQTEIWRQDPQRNTISLWNCECPWGGYSWGRTRQFKKYEGRPCAHTLALYWEALTHPLDEEYGDNQQLTIPGLDPYGGQPQQGAPSIDLNDAVQQTVRAPQPSQIVQPTQAEQLNLTFPGTFSKWHKKGALQNGDYARITKTVDRDR
jgi:hypothetical protein